MRVQDTQAELNPLWYTCAYPKQFLASLLSNTPFFFKVRRREKKRMAQKAYIVYQTGVIQELEYLLTAKTEEHEAAIVSSSSFQIQYAFLKAKLDAVATYLQTKGGEDAEMLLEFLSK